MDRTTDSVRLAAAQMGWVKPAEFDQWLARVQADARRKALEDAETAIDHLAHAHFYVTGDFPIYEAGLAEAADILRELRKGQGS